MLSIVGLILVLVAILGLVGLLVLPLVAEIVLLVAGIGLIAYDRGALR